MLTNQFYEKEATCPVCLTTFNAVVIKSNKCIPSGKDSDFRFIYKDVTPYLYDIWVCPECHYAAPKNIFNKIKEEEVLKIAEVLSKGHLRLNPLGEREFSEALLCNKLALLCMSYRKVPVSLIAGVCLKTAWIYRTLKDPLESDYLHKAIRFYKEAYSSERFPITGLSEPRLAYLIGELSRRLHDYQEAIYWFNKAVSSPMSSAEPAIVKMARDQWSLAKEQYGGLKVNTSHLKVAAVGGR